MTAGGPWWQGIMALFDLETTGVDVWNDRVVTASFILVRPNTPTWDVEVKGWLVNPGIPIPAEATQVHGITDETAQRLGLPPEQALNEVSDEVYQCLNAGIPILGMNIAYDNTLLMADCVRNDVLPPHRMSDFYGPFVDALVLDKYLDPYRRGKRNLPALCRHYGVRIDGAHDSTHDALAAGRVIYRQAQRSRYIGDMDLMALHNAQAGWRAAQCASLQEYFRVKNPHSTVDPCWPVCYGH